jgi:hypothetical protein
VKKKIGRGRTREITQSATYIFYILFPQTYLGQKKEDLDFILLFMGKAPQYGCKIMSILTYLMGQLCRKQHNL